MKKFLHNVLIGAATVASLAAPLESDAVTLYGVRRYNISGGSSGLYSIEATPGAQPQLEWADGDMMGNAGAVYADGTLYVLSYISFMGIFGWGYQICDVEEKTYDFLVPDGLDMYRDVAGCLTYDPSTDIIYAVCLEDRSGTRFNISTMDKATGIKTPLYELERRLFTLASTAAGQLYGVAEDGMLYKLNKYNGEMTEVGPTGVIPSADQTAVIDYETNVMYWSAYTEEGAGLYTTDITTGATEEVTRYDDGWQFTGLFIKQVALSASAPAAVENLEAIFNEASLSGRIEFTLPTKSANGKDLTSDVDYTVSLAGNDLVTGSGAPGSKVSADVTVAASGSQRFVVSTASGTNPGAAVNVELWVGMDTPKAVTNVTISADGDVVTTSWTLPERGVHDGYVDHSLVRYTIDRGPEDETILKDFDGTTLVETVDRTGVVYPVMYRITPHIDNLVGEGVITNWIRVGECFVPPCTIDFTDPFNSLVVDVYDANRDRATWIYDENRSAMACQWPISDDYKRDDWMFTMPIKLEGNIPYLIGAEVASEGQWNNAEECYKDVYAGELAIFIGRNPFIGSMNTRLVDYATVERVEYDHRKGVFRAPESGMYYLGFHVRGGVPQGNIYNTLVRSIIISGDITSVDTVGADAEFGAVGVAGGIAVVNPSGESVRVVSLDGRVVAVTSSESATLSLAKGVYIVTTGTKSVKVAVK